METYVTILQHSRASKMHTDLRNLIEGHAPNTIDFKYYGGSLYPLEPLHEEIVKSKI